MCKYKLLINLFIIIMKAYVLVILLSLIVKVILIDLPETIVIGNNQKLSFQITEVAMSTCKTYKLNTQYNKIGFHLLNFTNVDTVVISNRFPSACRTCDSSSEVCQISKITKPNQFVNFFWKLCLDELYIIISPKKDITDDIPQSASLFFESIFYPNSPCTLRQETNLSYCTESKIDDCKACKRPGCSAIECGNISGGKFVGHFDLCISKDLTTDDKEQMCSQFDGITTYNKNNSTVCYFDDLDGYSFSSVFIIFILVAFVIVFSIVVIYYNFYVSYYFLIS